MMLYKRWSILFFCIVCPIAAAENVFCAPAGAEKQIGNIPLHRTRAWRQSVEQLRRYREGGEAPQPMPVRGFAPAPSYGAASEGRAVSSPFRASSGSFPGRATPDWENVVRLAGGRYGVSEALLTAVLQVESNFNPRAVSPKGARGAMQIMPETGRSLGLTDFFDPEANIDAGTRYLASLLQTFSRTDLALAAYNAGPAAVIKYGGIPPYPETRDYVARVLALYGALQAPGPKTTRKTTLRRQTPGALPTGAGLPSSHATKP